MNRSTILKISLVLIVGIGIIGLSWQAQKYSKAHPAPKLYTGLSMPEPEEAQYDYPAPTPSDLPAESPSAEMTSFTNDEYSFKVDYPNNWIQTGSAGTYGFAPPNTQGPICHHNGCILVGSVVKIQVYTQKRSLELEAPTLDSLLQTDRYESLQSITFANEPAEYLIDYSQTEPHTAIAVEHNDSLYVIHFLDAYGLANLSYDEQKIYNSFMFTD